MNIKFSFGIHYCSAAVAFPDYMGKPAVFVVIMFFMIELGLTLPTKDNCLSCLYQIVYPGPHDLPEFLAGMLLGSCFLRAE